MKILHVISSGGMYGAEAVILNLSRALNERSHQSILGVFSNSSQPNLQLHERAIKEGIETHLIPCNGQVDRAVPSRIRELIREIGADVVHAHGYKADVYAYVAMKKTATPLVSTSHGWIDSDVTVRLYGALDRFLLRSYAGIVAVSDEVKGRLLRSGVQAGRIRLIRNGVDLRPFEEARRSRVYQERDDHPLCVGLVGRLSYEKGVDLFLRAAARVVPEFPQTKFAVVGDGPEKATLEALIDQLNLRENVALPGRTDDVPFFYASIDVLVLSSRQEGLPIALLEGMASGLPIVASRIGFIPNIIRDGVTGVTVMPEDVKELAEAIKQMLRDPSLRERMGRAARNLVAEEYSAERMTTEYVALYEKAVAERQRKAN